MVIKGAALPIEKYLFSNSKQNQTQKKIINIKNTSEWAKAKHKIVEEIQELLDVETGKDYQR